MRLYAGAAALLGWCALVLQLYLLLAVSLTNGNGLIVGTMRFFSFFTILTNMIVALALTWAWLHKNANGDTDTTRFFARPNVTTGIAASVALVGIAYNLLLRHLWQPQGLQWVADELLHDVMPVVFVLYWWFFVAKGRYGWHNVLSWLIYPTLYFVYALGQGGLSGWYPYPFLDVAQLGYARVLVNAAGVLSGFVIIAFVLVILDRLKAERSVDAS